MPALVQTRGSRSRRLSLARSWARRTVISGRMRMPAFRARRLTLAVAVVLVLTVTVAPSALAYFTSTGAGAGTGAGGTLAAPTGVTPPGRVQPSR